MHPPHSSHKPFSQAAENNKVPILEKLTEWFQSPGRVLEIGSGTGQHATHFARHLPHLIWQASEQDPEASGLNLWLSEAGLSNTPPALSLDATTTPFSSPKANYLFSANTLHIMSWKNVQIFFRRIHDFILPGAKIVFYGPFNYGGQYTSESNARFDQWLKTRNPEQGIRDLEAITQALSKAGITLIEDAAMPANNRLLLFHHKA